MESNTKPDIRKPNRIIQKGDLIGIADGEVYFVETIATDENNNMPVVFNVSTYRPVFEDMYSELSDKSRAINNDAYDYLHDAWKDAVSNDRTEDSYQDWAEAVFCEEQSQAEGSGNQLWFFGQDCSGSGFELVSDMDLHNRIKEDLQPFVEDNGDIASWECSSWMSPADRDNTGIYHPVKWDIVYDKEAADACDRYSEAMNNRHTINVRRHFKIVNGEPCYVE